MGPNFMLHQPIENQILAGLPEQELQKIRPHLTRIRLVPGQVLVEFGQITEHAFFVDEGIVSLLAEADSSHSSVQVAMIGREGFIGHQALLGIDTGAFAMAVTQVPGPVLRVPVGELRRLATECPVLQQRCLAAGEALVRQMMQTSACNARNTLAERCVRWLLMAHDRIEGDDVPVTHDALSAILGVRRSGVTVVVSGLQDAGLVRVNRGRITIIDRSGLEQSAGSRSWRVSRDDPPSPSSALASAVRSFGSATQARMPSLLLGQVMRAEGACS